MSRQWNLKLEASTHLSAEEHWQLRTVGGLYLDARLNVELPVDYAYLKTHTAQETLMMTSPDVIPWFGFGIFIQYFPRSTGIETRGAQSTVITAK
jgi:hypothetical protein